MTCTHMYGSEQLSKEASFVINICFASRAFRISSLSETPSTCAHKVPSLKLIHCSLEIQKGIVKLNILSRTVNHICNSTKKVSKVRKFLRGRERQRRETERETFASVIASACIRQVNSSFLIIIRLAEFIQTFSTHFISSSCPCH